MNKKPQSLHPRNPHQGRYDFDALVSTCPDLSAFIKPNPKGDNTIDFADAKAVFCLNRALLAHYYQVHQWHIPEGYLVPPIPGRADMIHYLADLLADGDTVAVGKSKGKKIKVLDIGTGANCIYPVIGSQTYGWQFVASDIDPVSIEVAKLIVESNPGLKKLIKPVLQTDPELIFTGVIKAGEHFDLTLCNPPFHASIEEAQEANSRKVKNLGLNKEKEKGRGKGKGKVKGAKPQNNNFGGKKAELWCTGGELGFITKMAEQSVEYAEQVGWFSSLVSKSENVPELQKRLKRLGAVDVRVIPMAQGQKISRIIAWRYKKTS
ncbi:MAG: 23S rRNA (adenine(1618)-N(6))-methyltransferase RlmF [Algicola sp.]|nr:23S rRNA (adenine(1618)-N(6))-methyltransferase RlmF [Algicola sp.]